MSNFCIHSVSQRRIKKKKKKTFTREQKNSAANNKMCFELHWKTGKKIHCLMKVGFIAGQLHETALVIARWTN